MLGMFFDFKFVLKHVTSAWTLSQMLLVMKQYSDFSYHGVGLLLASCHLESSHLLLVFWRVVIVRLEFACGQAHPSITGAIFIIIRLILYHSNKPNIIKNFSHLTCLVESKGIIITAFNLSTSCVVIPSSFNKYSL